MNLTLEATATPAVIAAEEPQRPAAFVDANPWLFESIHSYDWFVRMNYDELVAGGALIRPAGRNLVIPAAFKRVAMAIGQRRATRGGS